MRTDLKSTEDLRKDYYFTETATLVSPHTMRLNMDKGQVDFVLVDVRAAEDYQRGHIKGAINIPFDGKPESVNKFRKALEDGKKDRRSYAIVYCYSSACMLGRKTGQELAKQGISVKELSIGYNDWEQEHTVWNNPGEIYDINNYIISGGEPGELTPSKEFLNRPCSVDDKFSC
jgi:rhodanese-related sulfurtransferase